MTFCLAQEGESFSPKMVYVRVSYVVNIEYFWPKMCTVPGESFLCVVSRAAYVAALHQRGSTSVASS